MNKLLIISPYFPPSNAADMQRIRMSLPYFKLFGWQPEVVTVDPLYSDLAKDNLLIQSIPDDVVVHRVKALSKTLTSKVGLGSIAIRSLFYYRQKVNQLLKNGKYDLIYFSTTQFPVCILGAYWKKKFKVPYVIDLQDPWHSDYYQDKPKDQRPPKYWFSYHLNKYTEALAIKHVDGLISVSQQYIDDIKDRYKPDLNTTPAQVITFSAAQNDFQIALANKSVFPALTDSTCKNIVYIGRGGVDMHKSLNILFKALQTGLQQDPELFGKLHLTFIGTSYAPAGQGKPTIAPLASAYHLDNHVTERTDRISYYHTLNTLLDSDALLILGSDAKGYTASKIYPYLSTQVPLLSLLDEDSAAADVLKEFNAPYMYNFNKPDHAIAGTLAFLEQVAGNTLPRCHYNNEAVIKYSAESLTLQQCKFFDSIVNAKN